MNTVVLAFPHRTARLVPTKFCRNFSLKYTNPAIGILDFCKQSVIDIYYLPSYTPGIL